MDDIVYELRDEAVYFDGFDWLERRRNDRLEACKTEQRTRAMEESRSSDNSSLSSRSDGSTMSPVLSTSTLQTMPFPLPKEAILIPVSPIVDPPWRLRPILYIPELLIYLHGQNLEVFQLIWSDTCRPLYHCQYKIYERAKTMGSIVQIAPENVTQPVMAAAKIRPPSPEVNKAEADDEDLDYDSYYGEEFFSEEGDEALSPSADHNSPEVPDVPLRKRSFHDVAEPVRSKKRNSEELEVVEVGAGRKWFKAEDIFESLPMSLENTDHFSCVRPLEEEEP
ncbi:hypothetical protein EDD18DRAFT_1382925 [Armillaria luteobubalina]|uniref:Uncharacterized protein n=1 Tax=Armillaria luteobubalina TaxID=153913 RepID=A0AA39P414_9AGAR|nr:hypothetical protein EDD18DRAFT_1382925 [Armillaria luteobubalina]